MLTDPNYFKFGAQYPPDGSVDRHTKFEEYENIYNGSIQAWRIIYPATIASLQRERGFSSIDDAIRKVPHIRHNMFRKLSRFWGSLLYAHPPIIDTAIQDTNRVGLVTRSIYEAGNKVSIDASRFGTGVFYVANTGDDDIVRSVKPAHWFPVVDSSDRDNVVGDIIAVPYSTTPRAPMPDRLRVTRLIVGEPSTIQTFKIGGGRVEEQQGETEQGGVVSERAIATVVNGYDNDHYGESDYPDLIPLVAEIDERISGNSSVLKRHTNPHMYGPRSAITHDANGNAMVNIDGQYFPLDEDDKEPGYLTWDANLEANFTQIQHCLNLFHTLSDTSAAAFGIQGDGNSVESGAALRKLLYTSFLRLGNLRRMHEKAIRRILNILIPRANPTITWNEPFLDGLIDASTAEATRLQSGTTSRVQAIQRLDHVTEREALETIEEIDSDEGAQPNQPNEPLPNNGPGNQNDNSGNS